MSTNKKTSNEFFFKMDDDDHIGYPVHAYFVDMSKMHMHRLRWHWHSEIEIVIINHGELDFFSDDIQIRLTPGQGMLINQNTIHSLQTIDENANCGIYSISFHPSFLFGYGNTLLSSKYMTPILSSPIFDILLLDENCPWQEKILDTINNVIAINIAKKYGYELLTKSYLCQFWLQLLEQFVPQNATSTKQSSISIDETRVKSAILYLETHYREAISLEDLAESIHISKSECCRCFKRTLAITPIEYLMRYRILQSANILQNNQQSGSISDLAFQVGFNNVSYFNKLFKHYIKCTPKEYRQMIISDPTSASGPSNIFMF